MIYPCFEFSTQTICRGVKKCLRIFDHEETGIIDFKTTIHQVSHQHLLQISFHDKTE